VVTVVKVIGYNASNDIIGSGDLTITVYGAIKAQEIPVSGLAFTSGVPVNKVIPLEFYDSPTENTNPVVTGLAITPTTWKGLSVSVSSADKSIRFWGVPTEGAANGTFTVTNPGYAPYTFSASVNGGGSPTNLVSISVPASPIVLPRGELANYRIPIYTVPLAFNLSGYALSITSLIGGQVITPDGYWNGLRITPYTNGNYIDIYGTPVQPTSATFRLTATNLVTNAIFNTDFTIEVASPLSGNAFVGGNGWVQALSNVTGTQFANLITNVANEFHFAYIGAISNVLIVFQDPSGRTGFLSANGNVLFSAGEASDTGNYIDATLGEASGIGSYTVVPSQGGGRVNVNFRPGQTGLYYFDLYYTLSGQLYHQRSEIASGGSYGGGGGGGGGCDAGVGLAGFALLSAAGALISRKR
jgi:hypothetical protein